MEYHGTTYQLHNYHGITMESCMIYIYIYTYIYVVINGVANGIKSWLISFTNIYIYICIYIYTVYGCGWKWCIPSNLLPWLSGENDDQPVELRYHVFKHTVEPSGSRLSYATTTVEALTNPIYLRVAKIEPNHKAQIVGVCRKRSKWWQW